MQFDMLEIYGTGFGLARSMLLSFWPVFLIGQLRGRRPFAPDAYLFVWAVLAAFWAAGWLLPPLWQKPLFALIPEPWNTVAFVGVGGLLLVWRLLPLKRSRHTPLRNFGGESPIEKIFWEHAQPHIPDLQRQYPIGRYRADFFVPSANLVIELNGLAYHSGREKRIRDAVREREIERRGYRVMTFLGPEITQDPDRCVAEVLAVLSADASALAQPAPRAGDTTKAPARALGLTDRQLMVLGGLGTLVALAVVALGATVAFVVVGGY